MRWVQKHTKGIRWTSNNFEKKKKRKPSLEWDEQDCQRYLGAIQIMTSSTCTWLTLLKTHRQKKKRQNEHTLNCSRMLSSLPFLGVFSTNIAREYQDHTDKLVIARTRMATEQDENILQWNLTDMILHNMLFWICFPSFFSQKKALCHSATLASGVTASARNLYLVCLDSCTQASWHSHLTATVHLQ